MIVEFEHPMGPVKVLGNPLHLSGTPVTYRRRPPLLGEHTDEVLGEAAGELRSVVTSPPAPERLRSRRRPPRYAAELALAVEHYGRTASTSTINVSDGGCAVRWTGHVPRVGDDVTVKVETGFLGARARAIVCWSRPNGAHERTVGLRVIGELGATAWGALVADVVRSGARAA